MTRYLKANMSRNERNKVNMYQDDFGYNITNNSREEFLLDKNN